MQHLKNVLCFLFYAFYLFASSQTIVNESIFLSGPVFTVSSAGDTVFVGSGSALELYKIEPHNQFTFLGKAHTIDVVTSIVKHHHTIYTGNNGIGFSVFDISNPLHPHLLSIIYDTLIPGHHPPVIDQNRMFLSVGSYGVIVMDINNPHQPTEICRWKTPDFMLSVYKHGNTILAADRSYGIILLHFDGQTLIPFDTLNPFPGCAWYAFTVDELSNVLWLYCYGSAIPFNNNVYVAALSLHSQQYLQVLGSFSFSSRPVASLTIRHQKAFMACWEQGLKIFDVSDIHNPSLIHTIPTSSYTLWTHPVNDSLLAIAQYSEGVQIISILHPAFPTVAIIDHHGDIKSIAINDSIIYSITLTHGINGIVHQNNTWNEQAETFLPDNEAVDITAYKNHLYVASDAEGLKVYQIQPMSLSPVWQQAIQGAIAVHIHDTLLFCIRSYYNWLQRPVEMYIFHIKQPHAPMLITSHNIITQSWPQDRPLVFMDVMDTLFAISCWNDALAGSLHIYSIAKPHQPTLLYQMITARAAQLQWLKYGNEILLATAWGTSVPGNPNGMKLFRWQYNELEEVSQFVSGSNGNRTVGLACGGKYCFLAEGGLSAHGHVYMLEIDSSFNISLKHKLKIGSNTNHHVLRIWNNYLIHAAGSPGLMIFRIHADLHILEPVYPTGKNITIYPNPASEWITIQYPWQHLSIYDNNGKFIGQITQYTEKIPVTHLPCGLYYILLDNKTVGMFIKQ